MVVSPETWWETRAWAPSLVILVRGAYVFVTGRVVIAGSSRNRGGAETTGLQEPKWGPGALVRAPPTEMPAAGPSELAQGVPGCRYEAVRA